MPLLNHYCFLERNLRKISNNLQEKASKVNLAEQSEKSERELRQFKDSKLRSLPHLVGEEHIFGQLHMWFVFLLRSQIFKNVLPNIIECPVDCCLIGKLKNLYDGMPQNVFETIAYCILTGITVTENQVDCVKYFHQLLPTKFKIPTGGKSCTVFKQSNWDVNFEGVLPQKLPKLYTSIETAFKNKNMLVSTLQYHIMSLIMKWFNIACVLNWAPNKCDNLLLSLEVQKCDLPLLSYWIPQCNACTTLPNTDNWLNKSGL